MSRATDPAAGRSRAGFFGKIPSRGDFVRARLSSAFVQAWDGWMRQVLPGSEAILGERWEEAWRATSPWRFVLPAGQCGPRGVAGVWLPSADRVGRPWPLVIVAEGACASQDFLDEAERLGRDVLTLGLSPSLFAAGLDDLPVPGPADAPRRADAPGRADALAWWRAPACRTEACGVGACGVGACGTGLATRDGLPDAACFAAMLGP